MQYTYDEKQGRESRRHTRLDSGHQGSGLGVTPSGGGVREGVFLLPSCRVGGGDVGAHGLGRRDPDSLRASLLLARRGDFPEDPQRLSPTSSLLGSPRRVPLPSPLLSHLRLKLNLRRAEGIVRREGDLHKKHPSCEGAVRRAHNGGLPMEKVLPHRPCGAGRRRVLRQVLKLLLDALRSHGAGARKKGARFMFAKSDEGALDSPRGLLDQSRHRVLSRQAQIPVCS